MINTRLSASPDNMTFVCADIIDHIAEALDDCVCYYFPLARDMMTRNDLEFNLHKFLQMHCPLPVKTSIILVPNVTGDPKFEIRVEVTDLFQTPTQTYRLDKVF